VSPLTDLIDSLGLTSAWIYLALFLAASLLMVWRLEALLEHGLEGTALGTIVMPYCSGLGNLLFVAIIAAQNGPGGEVLTNCLVNNVTNLTLILGLPALIWGLTLAGPRKKSGASPKKKASNSGDTERQLNRLSLLLTLAAVVFFSGATWAVGADGTLDANDGMVLIGLFLFWQCFQVFDVLKHNVRRKQSFSAVFYLDVVIVLVGAYGVFGSLDWLVTWLSAQKGAFINAGHLGWLTGWLMVLPNALLAFYYAARKRADIAYASQVGDGHICIPLCIGISAIVHPIHVPGFFETGLAILIGAAVVHAVCVLVADGLPRWMGWPLLGAYAWFLAAGLMG
jgi:cation:H+ antiporter